MLQEAVEGNPAPLAGLDLDSMYVHGEGLESSLIIATWLST